MSSDVAKLSLQENKTQEVLVGQGQDSQKRLETISISLRDIEGQEQETQDLILSNFRENRSAFSALPSRFDAQRTTLSDMPLLPSAIKRLSDQIAKLDHRTTNQGATLHAIEQAQHLLAIKDQVVDMSQALQKSSSNLGLCRVRHLSHDAHPNSSSPHGPWSEAIEAFLTSTQLMGEAFFYS